MKKLIVLLILMWCGWAGGATYYVIDDPANSGTKVCYKSSSWPTGADTCNTNIKTLWLATSSGDAIVLDGGISGKSYSGTQLWVSSNPLISQQTNITIRSAVSGDPDYANHSGNVTITSSSNSTISNTHAGTVFSGISFVTTGGSGYVIGSSADMTIISPSIINGSTIFFSFTGGTNTLNITSYSGSADKIAVNQTSGTGSIVINSGIWDLTSVKSVQPFYVTAGTSFIVDGGTFTGSDTPNSVNTMFSIAGVATQIIKPGKIINAGYISISSNNATTELKIEPATGEQFLEITGGNYHGILIQNTGSGGNHEISHVFAHDFKGDNVTYKSCGIVGSTGAVGVSINHNIILPLANGIDMQATTATANTISNNIIMGGTLPNCHGLDSQSGAYSNKFANNIVYKRTGIDKGQCFSFSIGTTHAHHLFDNNLCYLTNGQDADLVYGAYSADGSTSETYSTSLADWQAIVVTQSDLGWFTGLGGTGRAGVSDIYADPLFVDAPNGDYRLFSNSPVINQGAVIDGLGDLYAYDNYTGALVQVYDDDTNTLMNGGVDGVSIGAYEPPVWMYGRNINSLNMSMTLGGGL
jgi:hypothetical protein